ncbi:MAG: IS110 family transposase [Chloroflexota bacterium]|nr:IS110 family transposase [Chloroflexota bacterium]
MAIIGGFDLHRAQITVDYLDTETGEVRRGRIAPATRGSLRSWLAGLPAVRPAAFAVEACTGWRFVVEELRAAGIAAHLAEAADTMALRGPKRRAKTDRADARHLRQLLQRGALPESWIPPEQVLEARTRIRLYKALVDERTAWQQRIKAALFHHGVPPVKDLLTVEGRAHLEQAELSLAARATVKVGLRAIARIDEELRPLRTEFAALASRQPGCRALDALYGVGSVIAVAIWAELGDCRRFSSSRDAVRHTGLDVTVHASDDQRARGHLARQGPPVLRWALVEAAKCAARTTSPDHALYQSVAERIGANRAAITVARKLTRRAHHILRSLGDDAMAAA